MWSDSCECRYHAVQTVCGKSNLYEKETLIYSDINKLLHTISMITNIVISMREHNKDYFHCTLSFVDPSYVNEVQKRVPITFQKRQDLYKLRETKKETIINYYCYIL